MGLRSDSGKRTALMGASCHAVNYGKLSAKLKLTQLHFYFRFQFGL